MSQRECKGGSQRLFGFEGRGDALLHRLNFPFPVRDVRPRPSDGVVRESRDDVPVDVMDRLARHFPIVADHVEGLGPRRRFDGTAKTWQQRAQMRRQIVGQVGERGVFGLGDQQEMAGIDGPDVQECESAIGLVDLRGRDFAKDDPGENRHESFP